MLAFTVAGCLLLPILYVFRAPIISVYNSMRPSLLSGGGQQCINSLISKKVEFRQLGDIGTQDCPRLNAVKITSFQGTKISSPFIPLCPTANKVHPRWTILHRALDIWARSTVGKDGQ